jgi:hypothetical protein
LAIGNKDHAHTFSNVFNCATAMWPCTMATHTWALISCQVASKFSTSPAFLLHLLKFLQQITKMALVHIYIMPNQRWKNFKIKTHIFMLPKLGQFMQISVTNYIHKENYIQSPLSY